MRSADQLSRYRRRVWSTVAWLPRGGRMTCSRVSERARCLGVVDGVQRRLQVGPLNRKRIMLSPLRSVKLVDG